jgi:hypothetical protein
MMMVPLVLLYEFSILLSVVITRRRKARDTDGDSDGGPGGNIGKDIGGDPPEGSVEAG